MFAEWREVCNFEHDHDDYINCDLEDMSTITVDSLVSGMRWFITEIRKKDGNDFPPKMLYQIVLKELPDDYLRMNPLRNSSLH